MNEQHSWYERLPKVELHIHLEGSIPHAALWKLVQKYGGDPAVASLEALQQKFVYRDFSHFVEAWVWKNGFLREYEDFSLIAEAFAREQMCRNIRYTEAFYSAPDFARHGLEFGRLTEAIRTGLDRVAGTQVALVADLVRDYGPEQARRSLDEASEVREFGVIGIGIGGREHEYPPEPFAPVFKEARKRGFYTSAHAGEAAGAASVWGAVNNLKVDRIGHATRAVEDPALVDYLAEHRIALELCPLSNVRTGVCKSIGEHPVRTYFDRGMLISINTDDPSMFGNSLAGEYASLVECLDFRPEDIRVLIHTAILSSWLPQERQQELLEQFRADSAWQESNFSD